MKFVFMEDIKADNKNGFKKGLGKFMRITHIDRYKKDRQGYILYHPWSYNWRY